MFVRTVYATGNPDRIGQTLDGLRTEALALLTGQPGYRGYGLFADPDLGKITMGSWWDSAEAERNSDAALGARRAELLDLLAGTVTVDAWEVVAAAPPGAAGPGGGFRLTRFDIDPARVDAMAQVFQERALPALEKLDGFVTAAMLVDRTGGRGSVGAIFADQESFAASRGPNADTRAAAIADGGASLRCLEEFDVVLLDRPEPPGQ